MDKLDEEYDKKIQSVQSSNNPDKDFEYFWLTLKNIVNKHGEIKSKTKINEKSKRFNELQKLKQYDIIKNEINEYIEENISCISKEILMKKTREGISNLYTNLKRWCMYYLNLENIMEKCDYCCGLNVLGKLIKKGHKCTNDMIEIYYKFCLTKNKYEVKQTYIEIFNFALNNNLAFIIDSIYDKVDIRDINDKWDYDAYDNIKGDKIIKKLKNMKDK